MASKRSVSLKLVLAQLLAVAGALALGVCWFLAVERREYTEALSDEASQDASIILASLEHAMRVPGPDRHRTQELVRELSSSSHVHSMFIADATGRINIASDPSLRGSSIAAGEGFCAECHARSPRPRQLVSTVGAAGRREDFIRSVIPIFNKRGCDQCHRERVLGLVVTNLRTENMQAHFRRLAWRFGLLGLGIFAVITVSLALLAGRLVKRPVQALVRGNEALAGGDYDARIALRSDDEIGYLAGSFNLMVERIKASHLALESWNATLGEQVALRTRELSTANLALANEKQRAESMARSIVEGVLAVDADGKIGLINAAAAAILGLSEERAAGTPLEQAVKAAAGRFDAPGAFERLILERGPLQEGFLGVVGQTLPRRRVFKVSGSRIRGPGGVEQGCVFTFHDFSREHEIDETKTNLMAMVSHELHTPIAVVKGALSLLTDGTLDEGERSQFQMMALRNTNRLIDLINNMLDLAKIESGRVQYEFSRFPIKSFLEQCIQEMAVAASEGGASFALEVPDAAREVVADQARLHQVLVNILANAIRFSPHGGEIRVSVAAGPDALTFSVLDHGVGVPDEEKTRIFDKFHQVDMSSTRRVGGSGLGLAIAKPIVEAHGGTIWVEDTPGGGSTFRFTLPRAEAGAALSCAVPAAATVAAGAAAARVLVVEDEEAVRTILARYLREKQIDVIHAGSAKEGLALARGRRPDCITIDVMLPDIDGFDVITILKSDPVTRDIPVVFLTVVNGEGKAKALGMGADAYFVKPTGYDEVVDAISSLVRAERQGRG